MPVISIDNNHCMFYKLKINNSKDWRKTIYAGAGWGPEREEQWTEADDTHLRWMVLILI